jgi:hypothetical protein
MDVGLTTPSWHSLYHKLPKIVTIATGVGILEIISREGQKSKSDCRAWRRRRRRKKLIKHYL